MNVNEQECTFNFNGKPFTARGAYVNSEDGIAMVYVNETTRVLTDWHGNAVGQVKEQIKGAWRGNWRMAYVKADIGGQEYWGRYNCEGGQLVRLRKAKR